MTNYNRQFDFQDPSLFRLGDATSTSHNSEDLAPPSPNTERGGALLLADTETVLVFKSFKYLQMYRDLSHEKVLVFT